MMAFQYYYHWSQTEFYEHTRGRSGIGEGVYVSYIFVWLWLGDAAWWWIAPLQYARRSPWSAPLLHALHAVHRLQRHGGLRNRIQPLGRDRDVLPAGDAWLRTRGLPKPAQLEPHCDPADLRALAVRRNPPGFGLR